MLRIYAEQAEQGRREKISVFRNTGETVGILPPSKTRDRVAKAIDVLSCTHFSYNIDTTVVSKIAII